MPRGVVIFDLVFLALPTLLVLIASFTAGEIIDFPPDGLSLRWYARCSRSRRFSPRSCRSLEVALVCTALSLPAGTLAAIALARYRLRFAGALQVYLLLPFTIPLIVSGIGLMLLFGELGILGQLWPVGSPPA